MAFKTKAQLKREIAEYQIKLEEINKQLKGETDTERAELEKLLEEAKKAQEQAEAKLETTKAEVRGGTAGEPDAFSKEKAEQAIKNITEILNK